MPLVVYTVGQRVVHTEFGQGIVRSVAANGALLKVYFDSVDAVVGVHASSLAPEDPSPTRGPSRPSVSAATPETPRRSPTLSPVPPSGPDLRRLTIECLRQGLPPPGKLTSWTVGHPKARAKIDGAIARAVQGKGSVLFARAGYGQGKSHLGRLGRELAREQGLATLHLELDGKGRTLADGTRLVAYLFASVRLPASAADDDHLVPGLATLLKRAAPFARGGLPPALALFAPFLRDPHRWAESDEVIELLEEYISGFRSRADSERGLLELLGERISLESFKMDWGATEDRRKRQADQLGRIVQLAMLAGAKGGFVVLDELDHDFQGDTGKQSAMLRELGRITRKLPVVLLLLARELEMDGAEELELGDFTKPELEQLVEKSIDAFAAVHPSPALASGRGKLFDAMLKRFRRDYADSGWGPRFFVRAAVESCEAARLRKLDSLEQVAV